MSSTILPKNIDVSKFKFSEVKTLSNGSKTVYVSYDGGRLTVQTPFMSMPYGVGDWNGADADKKKDEPALKKYDLHVSFRDMENNPKLKVLCDKIKEIETSFKEAAFEHRVEWFSDDFDNSKSLVDRLFTPMLKYDKDKKTGKIVGKYPPTLKAKLPYDNKIDDFAFECTDIDGSEIDFKPIMTKLKGGKVRLILQLSGIWMAGGKYGGTWKVVKATVDLPSKGKYDYIEDSDDEGPAKKNTEVEEDEELEEEAMAMAHVVSPPAKKSTVASDSEEEDAPPPPPASKKVVVPPPQEDVEEEEEEEVDSEVEDEPTPPPPPKKKTTKAAAKK